MTNCNISDADYVIHIASINKETTMTTILRIDASARPGPAHAAGEQASFSRTLADAVQQGLTARYGQLVATMRDLATDPLPAIADATIKGFYTPVEAMDDWLRASTALSDSLIAELEAADILLISTPMYNFAVPAALKAWIDQIMRINRTFAYENGEFSGLLKGKRAYVAYSYGAGGYGDGGPLHSFDFMRPYLTMILNFIGIEEVTSFAVEATTADPATVDAAMVAAIEGIERHFAGAGDL